MVMCWKPAWFHLLVREALPLILIGFTTFTNTSVATCRGETALMLITPGTNLSFHHVGRYNHEEAETLNKAISHREKPFSERWLDSEAKKVCSNYVGTTMAVVISLPCFAVIFCAVVYVWVKLCQSNADGFESIEYLVMTWELETTGAWRCLMYLLTVVALLPASWALLGAIIVSKDVGTHAALSCILPWLVLGLSLKRLLFPPLPIMHWKMDAVRGVRFKRSWANLFFQANDEFAILLQRALYLDKLGNSEPLQNLVAPPSATQRSFAVVAASDPDCSKDNDSQDVELVEGSDSHLQRLRACFHDISHVKM